MIHDHKNSTVDGVLWDHGANAPIRFVRWYDDSSGEYEAIKVAANGIDMVREEHSTKAVHYQGRAKGRLELIPIGDAKLLGRVPQKVVEQIPTPLPSGAKEDGITDYKRLYFQVWQHRGEANRCVDERWLDFLKNNPFLDSLVLRKGRLVTT